MSALPTEQVGYAGMTRDRLEFGISTAPLQNKSMYVKFI